MRFFYALLAAIAFHAVLGALIALYIDLSDGLDESAMLDLSAVELSLSDEELESAEPAVKSMPTAEVPPPPEREPERPEIEPPDTFVADKAPEIERVTVPDAEEPAPPKMDMPPPPPARPVEKQAEESPREDKPVPHAAESSESAPAPVQAKVDEMPKLRRTIRPKYPKASRERGEKGSVRLRLGINARGLVETAEIVTSTGFRLLDEAALNAVKAARFIPAKLRGEAVFSTAEINLDFKLD